jgi:hypothetical protein
LGYDYHPDDKTITVNPQEAEIVRYIFTRYTEGAGCMVIGKELENLGYKTKRGSTHWAESTIVGIIRNEKYKGDILMGKTFTVDPISKRRLNNFGEEDKFYIKQHHEPIISEEVFEKAQEILRRRSRARKCHVEGGKREKFSRQYAFSCMLECGFCGGTLIRRSWHAGTKHQKTIWQCVTSTKKGKVNCPDSKGIPEEAIEKAFVESYSLLCDNDKDVLKEFLQRMEQVLSSSNVNKQLAKVEKDISSMQQKRSKLVDLHLDGSIDKATYQEKSAEINSNLEQLESEREGLLQMSDDEKDNRRRLLEFKKTLEQNGALEKFNRYVFESIVEKVIVGGTDDAGNKDPYKLTFIYKTGFEDNRGSTKFKLQRKCKTTKSSSGELCCNASDEVQKSCSDTSVNTC